MLKSIELLNEPAPSQNNNNKSAFSRNNNSKPAFRRNNNNSEVNRFGISKNGVKYAKKSAKLFQLKKSKSKKMFKS